MKRIFVDIDMTLNDLWSQYVGACNLMTGQNKKLGREDCVEYNMAKCYGFPDKEAENKSLHDAFHYHSFFEAAPMIDEFASPVMERLCEKYEVYLVTAPYIPCLDHYREKRNWVKKNLPFFDAANIIFTDKKFLLRGDLLIDDKPANLETFEGAVVALDHPYNRDVMVDGRVSSWESMEAIITGILGE